MTALGWTHDDVVRCVVETVRELLALESFDAGSPIVGALDSLAITQLVLAIEEKTGVWVDESLLTPENLATAETFAACVHAQLAAA